MSACEPCLRRAWLVAALAGHIDALRGRRRRLPELLALSDARLIAALAGARRTRLEQAYAGFDAAAARARCARARLDAICRHDARYPAALSGADRPAVLHVAGGARRFADLVANDPVAVVGARRASTYGLEVARGLGRELDVAGVTTVSGMALGADSAAHEGTLTGSGATIAVLATGADRPYPAAKRRLYERIVARGAVVSEFPPGFSAWRWAFPARNRIIAGLAGVTVVVEATARSGSLITAELAAELGREVGAVPGRVTSPLAIGTNRLIADGAHLVRDAGDVLDLLFGVGRARDAAVPATAGLRRDLRDVLVAVGAGGETVDGLIAASAGADVGALLAALAELELLGLVRRDLGGRYAVVR